LHEKSARSRSRLRRFLIRQGRSNFPDPASPLTSQRVTFQGCDRGSLMLSPGCSWPPTSLSRSEACSRSGNQEQGIRQLSQRGHERQKPRGWPPDLRTVFRWERPGTGSDAHESVSTLHPPPGNTRFPGRILIAVHLRPIRTI